MVTMYWWSIVKYCLETFQRDLSCHHHQDLKERSCRNLPANLPEDFPQKEFDHIGWHQTSGGLFHLHLLVFKKSQNLCKYNKDLEIFFWGGRKKKVQSLPSGPFYWGKLKKICPFLKYTQIKIPQIKIVSLPSESQIKGLFSILFEGFFIFISYQSKPVNNLTGDTKEDN